MSFQEIANSIPPVRDGAQLLRTAAARNTGWQHPSGRWPDRVALLSLGASVHSYISECMEADLSPAVIGRDEVWTVNRGIMCFRHDLAFVMDHLGGEERAYPHYGAALRRHDRPIITSDNCDGWPDHVFRYPLDAIRRHFGQRHDYYFNSIPFVLAYASWIGVRELTIWGADYNHELCKRREDDRPNAEYWIAICRERGMTIAIPNTSTLCNSNQGLRFYGYRDQPPLIPMEVETIS